VVLDLELTGDLDLPGVDALADLTEELDGLGATSALASIADPARELLEASGAIATIGIDRVHVQLLDAVRWHLGSGRGGS